MAVATQTRVHIVNSHICLQSKACWQSADFKALLKYRGSKIRKSFHCLCVGLHVSVLSELYEYKFSFIVTLMPSAYQVKLWTWSVIWSSDRHLLLWLTICHINNFEWTEGYINTFLICNSASITNSLFWCSSVQTPCLLNKWQTIQYIKILEVWEVQFR